MESSSHGLDRQRIQIAPKKSRCGGGNVNGNVNQDEVVHHENKVFAIAGYCKPGKYKTAHKPETKYQALGTQKEEGANQIPQASHSAAEALS
mmetsp:Transcript_3270/g.7062  ORF Transcript_3270/g.7062 Transcript_3270/m.7062 type:complete len:92 (-) Transcript_3270:3233-3508(-)